MFSSANPKDRNKPAKRPIGHPKGSKNGPNAGKGGRPVGRPKKGADSQGTAGGQQGECFSLQGACQLIRLSLPFQVAMMPTKHQRGTHKLPQFKVRMRGPCSLQLLTHTVSLAGTLANAFSRIRAKLCPGAQHATSSRSSSILD
jgi:hypothetical protein